MASPPMLPISRTLVSTPIATKCSKVDEADRYADNPQKNGTANGGDGDRHQEDRKARHDGRGSEF
jgi:hypothetical protein